MKKFIGVLSIAVVLMFLAVPVFAQTDVESLAKRVEKIENAVGAWSFYGSARMAAFWNDYSDNALTWMGGKTIYGEEEGLTFDLQGNSRIGAVVNRGNWGGGFEFGINDDGSNFATRLLYGTYNFSKKAQLLVGQMYTPTCTFISNQVWDDDVNFLFFAPAYNGRRPMIQFKYGGLKVALVKQHAQSVLSVPGGDIDTRFPKLEASYTFAIPTFFVTAYGGYQTYKIDSATVDYDVDSYVAGLTGGVTLGPAYVRGGVWTGQNYGNTSGYGIYTVGTHFGSDATVIQGGEVKDATAIGAALVAGFKATPALTFEAGVGYLTQDSDKAGVTDEDDAIGGYLQAVIKVGNSGLSFTPEVGYIDFKKGLTGNDQGDMWYGGVKTQIDF